jgi:hypothetical protein
VTRLEASQLVAVLFGSYPNAHVERRHVDAFVSGIVDLDAKGAAEAVTRLTRTSRFLPSIAEIREACAQVHCGVLRSGEEAYAELTRLVRAHGRDYGQGEPAFADPLLARCLGVWGSWNDLCASPSDDPGGRARFATLYDELAQRERQALTAGQALPSPAPGALRPVQRAPERLPAPAPATFVSELVGQVTARPPRPEREPATARRWSAAELDAALGHQQERA